MKLRWLLLLSAFVLASKTETGDPHGKPSPQEDPFRPLSVGERYAKKDSSVVKVFLERKNTTKVEVHQWRADADTVRNEEGLISLAGMKFIFEVPKAFRGTRAISKFILLHRKDLDDKDAMKPVAKIPEGTSFYHWDYEPCFHVVRCRSLPSKKWITWSGPHGPAKFAAPLEYRDPPLDPRRYAEPRKKGDPDYDCLNDVAKFMGQHPCDLIMVENVSDKLHRGARCRLHGLIAQYRPFRAKLNRSLDMVHIFTNGTRFAEPDLDILVPHFGGGQDQSTEEVMELQGIYPGAPKIRAAEPLNYHLNAWLTINNGGLIIRLRGGELWAGCELALGDRKLDPSRPVQNQVDRDGQVGIPGKALGFAYYRNRVNGRKSYLLAKYPVGAAQVMMLGPAKWVDINTPPSDTPNPFFSSFIRFDTTGDFAYLMGIRCFYFAKDSIYFKPRDYGPPGNLTKFLNGTSSTTTTIKKPLAKQTKLVQNSTRSLNPTPKAKTAQRNSTTLSTQKTANLKKL